MRPRVGARGRSAGLERVVAATLSVVVPVYNSEQTLGPLVTALEPILKELTSTFEIVLVNDGSRDRSWDVIQELSAKHGFVRGIDLMRNFGQHNALLAGIRSARHELVVTMDDDLQNPPSEIPKLVAKLEEGYDVVYGVPERQQHGLLRDLASSLTKWTLQGAMGAETAKHTSAFRVFRSYLREAFVYVQGPHVSIDVLLTWATSRFTWIVVAHEPRRVGASNYTLAKLVRHALNMVTGFSTMPLQIASYVGFLSTLLGLVVLLFVVGRYLVQGGSVPGFTFLAATMAIFSGAQMFTLGILGEYLGRVHVRMMDRPTYAVRASTPADGRGEPSR